MSAVTADPHPDTLSDTEAERVAERLPMPLPEDVRTVFLGGLFLLAFLAALYVASEIVLPIVLAFMLNLLLQPVIRLLYLLIFAESSLRRTVEILPHFNDKRRAVEIVTRIQHDLSIYLVTVAAINALVGLGTVGVMWLCGVGDAVLWGFLAFVLNFVPILGPMLGVALFVLVGALALGATWFALVPAALYFAIHMLEGEFVTPMLMARRFTINRWRSYWRWCSGTGCGAFPAPYWRCRCSPLPRSYVTTSRRCAPSGISSKAEESAYTRRTV